MLQRIIETKITIYTNNEIPVEMIALIEMAKKQVENAYAPYSEFHVGAAVELENGQCFAANNQENSAYPSGLCAERVAMFYANAQFPNVAAKRIAIAAFTKGEFLKSPITPCGSCRQVLLETEMRYEKDIEVILVGSEEVIVVSNIRQLLPLCFEKSSLNNKKLIERK